MLKVGDRTATESLKEILSGARKELDAERDSSRQLNKEVERLRSRINELEVNSEIVTVILSLHLFG